MVTLTLLEPQQKIPLQQWHFQDETVIRIGRSAENDIVLSDSLVSRHHLELRQTSLAFAGNFGDGSWQVTSKGTNGTF